MLKSDFSKRPFTYSLVGAVVGVAVYSLATSGIPALVSTTPAIADGENAATLEGNIAVSMPTRIEYVMKPDGTLMGPSSSAFYIQNESNREVLVSSVEATPSSGWNIVEDASQSDTENSVSINIHPAWQDNVVKHEISLADAAASNDGVETARGELTQALYTLGAEDGGDSEFGWNSSDGSLGSQTYLSLASLESEASRLELSTDGNTSHVAGNASASPIANTKWYVVDASVTDDVYDKLAAANARIDDLEDDNYALEQRLDAAETLLSSKTDTKVKGNAESTYRTGEVNLTYPNLGTAPIANGGTGATTAANARTNLGITPANIGALSKTSDFAVHEEKYNNVDFYAWVTNNANIHNIGGLEQVTFVRFFASDSSTYTPASLHLPVVDQHIAVFSIDGGNTWIRAIAFDIRSNNVYVNSRVNNTWSGWQKIALS